MGVHAARVSDLFVIRRLDRNDDSVVLSPMPVACHPSAVALAVRSIWRGAGKRAQTLVLRDGNHSQGFVQARARPGRESWDIVRLACLAADQDTWVRVCAELLDNVGGVAAQSGALRTFARVPSDSPNLALLSDSGFRPYASEIVYRGTLRPLAALEPRADVRLRRSLDAWDVFSLYCAVTPALIRHAEGRSLKEWATGHRVSDATFNRWSRTREVVVGNISGVDGWIRWSPIRSLGVQLLEVYMRPEAAGRLSELVTFGVKFLGLDPDCITLCKVREYDGSVSATLVQAGFDAGLRETLLVRHTVARVTERQLLVAALRAQGLGIDISRYGTRADVVHHRLASSMEVEHQYYDQFDRPARASGY